jgi:DNA-directed RNA polymerase subunit F
MGAVFRPKDSRRDYNKKILENAIKDLSPDTKDNVIKILDSWEGIRSEEKLKEILGQNKAPEELLKNIKANEEVNLTNDELKRLSNMFKESLTFD